MLRSQVVQEKVLYTRTKGACWARHVAQRFYEGEKFVMQIDSHHRFAPGSDKTAFEMMERSGSPKPLFSAYLLAHSGSGHKIIRADTAPAKLVVTHFDEDGVAHIASAALTKGENYLLSIGMTTLTRLVEKYLIGVYIQSRSAGRVRALLTGTARVPVKFGWARSDPFETTNCILVSTSPHE